MERKLEKNMTSVLKSAKQNEKSESRFFKVPAVRDNTADRAGELSPDKTILVKGLL